MWAASSPPPTRGSTVPGGDTLGEETVSPAHAGIDPGGAAVVIGQLCLPRPRGDRPAQGWVPPVPVWSPPPTRGSTGDPRPCIHPTYVSPAHAGIDRSATT